MINKKREMTFNLEMSFALLRKKNREREKNAN